VHYRVCDMLLTEDASSEDSRRSTGHGHHEWGGDAVLSNVVAPSLRTVEAGGGSQHPGCMEAQVHRLQCGLRVRQDIVPVDVPRSVHLTRIPDINPPVLWT